MVSTGRNISELGVPIMANIPNALNSGLLPSFFNTALVFMGNAFVHLVESSPRMHRLNELNRELEAK